ncbi:hypothetical protein STVIR_8222 [Streptomyces viridochromogenes Tue57]|uniref:Uncharacterized protein n=1 Tax=Streptomyces viridochromogenes Tue57 TaxID=1160705 RepID=L8P647_STRVR|nr:hypothetical protein STVIR_8222 [Streptomyces viridochromogenes Tue57]
MSGLLAERSGDVAGAVTAYDRGLNLDADGDEIALHRGLLEQDYGNALIRTGHREDGLHITRDLPAELRHPCGIGAGSLGSHQVAECGRTTSVFDIHGLAGDGPALIGAAPFGESAHGLFR